MGVMTMIYAHSEGHTDICFDDMNLVTSGRDGDVRIWNELEEGDCQDYKMGCFVSAVALKKNMLYISTDKFAVEAYSFPDIKFNQIIAQFNSEVYHIVCSSDGQFVACGGGDFVIKMYDTLNKSLTMFNGHDGPVLSLAFDPKGEYLASSGCDGMVRIWQLKSEECVKALNLFKKSNDLCTSSTLCRIDWSPNGKILAVPLETEVRFYQRDVWNSQFSLTDDCIIKTLSIVTFSPFGKYIAASSMNGQMLVWDVEVKKCVSRRLHEEKITVSGLKWHPSGSKLIYCDMKGQLGIYSCPFQFSLDDEDNAVQNAHMSSDKGMDIADKEKIIVDKGMDVANKGMDVANKGMDVANKGMDVANKQLDIADKEMDLSDKEMDLSDKVMDFFDIGKDMDDKETDIDDKGSDVFDVEDEDNVYDLGAIKASFEPTTFKSSDMEDIKPVKKDLEQKIQVIQAPKAPVQTSFQPSSTPVHLEHRFMLWNNIGMVRCYNTEEENSIDVEFHDANVYHPLHLNNTRNHTLAALSTEALLLASPILDGNTSKLECMHFGTWDSNKEWLVEMPEHEEIETIALGEGFAACVTDKKFVRLFTISGVQCEVFLLPGPAVSCAARGNQLLIVYHKGLGVEDNQCLNIMLVKVKLGGHCTMREYFLPLSPKAFLSWIGYTDEGKPCIVDTSGIISLLSTSCGTKWIPIADTTSNSKAKDTYFIIGLSEIKQEIRYILCKGARYPSLLPRPTISVFPFSLPFCEMSLDRGKLEEENQRYSLAHQSMESLLKDGFDVESEFKSVEKKWMEVLLKMFALATRSGQENRALDVAELMPNSAIVQGAIKYATQRHSIALAERLGEVMNKKISKEVEDIEDDDFDLPVYEDLSESLISKNLSTPNLNSFSKEDNLLKPKPISRIKGHMKKSIENCEQSDDDDSKPNKVPPLNNQSLFPKSSPLPNPFRASSKAQPKKEDTGNNSGIDDILNNSMKSVAARNSSGSVSTDKPKKSRFQMKKDSFAKGNGVSSEKEKCGFDLYLEENKEKIKATGDPDVTEKEIVKMAVKLYKELPKSEKEKYLKNTNYQTLKESLSIKTKNSSEGQENELNLKEYTYQEQSDSLNGQSGKRKEDNADSTPKPKKLKLNQDKLSDTTVRKLTQFAFTKTPK